MKLGKNTCIKHCQFHICLVLNQCFILPLMFVSQTGSLKLKTVSPDFSALY